MVFRVTRRCRDVLLSLAIRSCRISSSLIFKASTCSARVPTWKYALFGAAELSSNYHIYRGHLRTRTRFVFQEEFNRLETPWQIPKSKMYCCCTVISWRSAREARNGFDSQGRVGLSLGAFRAGNQHLWYACLVDRAVCARYDVQPPDSFCSFIWVLSRPTDNVCFNRASVCHYVSHFITQTLRSAPFPPCSLPQ
jgi:hypothetical protein